MNNFHKVLLFSFIFLFISSQSFAISISGVTDTSGNSTTIVNGAELVIHGSSFGSKSSAAPLISSYDNPNSADNFSSGAIGGDWTVRGSTQIANSSPRTSFYQSSYYSDSPYISGNYSQLRYDGPLTDQYYFVSFWFKHTAALQCNSSSGYNSKFVRFYANSLSSIEMEIASPTTDQGACTNGFEANSVRADIDGGTSGSAVVDWSNTFSYMPMQQWNHWTGWLYLGATNGIDGFLRVNANGQNVRNWTGIGLVSDTYPRTYSAWRFGQVSGVNDAGGSMLISDVYIDNTQAHVFISNRSDITNWIAYNQTAHNEVQVAASWSSDQIQFTVNQGSFPNGSTAYLYVVNPSGEISQAYPITFGASTTDTSSTNTGTSNQTSPPTAPTGLKIISTAP